MNRVTTHCLQASLSVCLVGGRGGGRGLPAGSCNPTGCDLGMMWQCANQEMDSTDISSADWGTVDKAAQTGSLYYM